MKFYIKQKVFSWTDRFSVTDEQGDPRFYVKGQAFSPGKRLRIYDESGEELATVSEVLFRMFPRYRVDLYGDKAAEIVKEFSFFRPSYRIEGPGWHIEGDLWDHDYRVTDGRRTVASIHKAWMKWGDFYELEIADPAHKLLALAVVLAIDCVIDRENQEKNGKQAEV